VTFSPPEWAACRTQRPVAARSGRPRRAPIPGLHYRRSDAASAAAKLVEGGSIGATLASPAVAVPGLTEAAIAIDRKSVV
jgi:hypothetical protein